MPLRPARVVLYIVVSLACLAAPCGLAGAQVLISAPFAGQTVGGPGATDGTGTSARLFTPYYLAIDASGNIYSADSDHHTIRKITPAGVVTTFAGIAGLAGTVDGPLTTARLNRPTGLAFDTSGNLYVAESAGQTIRKIAAGQVTTVAGLAGTTGYSNGSGTTARFNNPYGLTTDAGGNVYVSDSDNHAIRKVTPGGAVTTVAGLGTTAGFTDGTGTVARFRFPEGITIDGSGVLWVSDCNNFAIRRVTQAGVVTTFVGGTQGSADGTGTAAKFNTPDGLAFDASGNLWVADVDNSTIRRVASDGTVTTVAGSPGVQGTADGTGSAARFARVMGVAISTGGTIYIADWTNHTIRTMTPAGAVTTFVGKAPEFGSADGTGSAARFKSPGFVAVDSAGVTYVSDGGNCTIRKITLAGVVTTLAGNVGTCSSVDGTGTAASFAGPAGIAVDASGNLFVADAPAATIRYVNVSTRVVTTIAGVAGSLGSADGTGTQARFRNPTGLAIDPGTGTLYVADTNNHTIRTISGGVVGTLAGVVQSPGWWDGSGTSARFKSPRGLAWGAGYLHVVDRGNNTIRRVSTAGVVETRAGIVGSDGMEDGESWEATFSLPFGIAANDAGDLYITETNNHLIRYRGEDGDVVQTAAGRTTPQVATEAYRLVGHEHGSGVNIRLYFPLGIAWNPVTRRLIVADSGNQTIREFRRPPARTIEAERRADPIVYRPSTGTWFALPSSCGFACLGYVGWGMAGDVPVRGDFFGTGLMSVAVYRPSTGTWFLGKFGQAGLTSWKYFGWGNATDTLVPGDYDGDGMTDGAVYRSSTGTWYIRPSSGAPGWNVLFGASADTPVPADYDGDGKTDIAVYRPTTGTWFVLTSSSNFTSWWFKGWGVNAQGDTPAPADYDGDGKADICVFRPGTGSWFVLQSSTNYATWTYWGWGAAGDELMPADYDGDGITDAAVYRPSNYTWYIRRSDGGGQWTLVFGRSGDVPMQGIR